MPYDPNNVEDLPKNVQEMSDHDKRMWTHVWNRTYEKHGDEKRAFKYANGVMKRRLEGKGLFDLDREEWNDPERDILLEFEFEDRFSEMDLETKIAKEIGLEVELKP